MMAEEKKIVPVYQVYRPVDLSKKWFVYWYEGAVRQRKYGSINKYHTAKEREAEALRLIAALEQLHVATPAGHIMQRLYAHLDSRRHQMRQKSYYTYRSKINTLATWLGSREPTAELMCDFFKELRAQRHNTTYNTYRQKLRQLFAEIGEGHLVQEVSRGAKETRTPARYFQPYQIRRLTPHLQADPTLWLFVQFIYYCFIRPGELRWLRAGDVLLEEKRILVRGEISKNKKTEYIAIPEPFLTDLKFVRAMSPNDLLFPSPDNLTAPIGINTMSTRHRKILKALGFNYAYKLYSWKHTGAVMAVKAGIPLKELQMQLRHHSLDQVNEYLRQMGVQDMRSLQERFPSI